MAAPCGSRLTGRSEPFDRIRYESEDGVGGIWTVEALSSDGKRVPARTVPVEGSSAGSSHLVFREDFGLSLTSLETGAEVAEAFLLLADSAFRDSRRVSSGSRRATRP